MKGMNERHELKMHGAEPEAWPQKNSNSYQPLADLCGNYSYSCLGRRFMSSSKSQGNWPQQVWPSVCVRAFVHDLAVVRRSMRLDKQTKSAVSTLHGCCHCCILS